MEALRRDRFLRPLPLALALFLAGCASPAPLSLSSADGLDLLEAALVDDHDHADPQAHPGASWRMHEVYHTLLPTDGAALSPASEFVIHDHFAYVSLFHPSGGFAILDLTDPTRPVQVGRYDAGSAYVNDVEVSPDGRWAFLPTSPIQTRENDLLGGGLPVLGDYGIQVVDVSDATQPSLATFFAAPDPTRDPANPRTFVSGLGYHRLDLELIGESLYVFCASLGFPRVDILRFEAEPVPQLVPVGLYLSDDARDPTLDHRSNSSGHGVHDVTVDPDPVQGFPLMAVAHWRSGAHFLDVSDPANPRFLGRWDAFPVAGGNVHNVMFTAIEGRRVAVAVPEYPAGDDRQGGVWVVDVHDFARPALLGAWVLPGHHPPGDADPGQGNFVFSTDRVEVRDGTVFDAHFHAGAIVLDIGTLAKARAPELLGFVLPEGHTRVPYRDLAANPYVYDAIPYGKWLYTTDLTGGLHVAEMEPEVLRGNLWAG